MIIPNQFWALISCLEQSSSTKWVVVKVWGPTSRGKLKPCHTIKQRSHTYSRKSHTCIYTTTLYMHKYKQSNLLHFLFHVPTNHTSFNHHKSLLSSHFLLIVMFKCKMNCCKSMGTNLGRQIETVLYKKIKLFTPLHANHTLVCTPLLWFGSHVSMIRLFISILYVYTNLTSIDHPKSILSYHFLLRAKFKYKMTCCKSMGAIFERQIETVPNNKTKLFTPLHANHTLVWTPLLLVTRRAEKRHAVTAV